MSDSPYDVLAVPATASADEIRAAYRALVKRHHPDAPSGSPDLFRAVQAAYDVISDAEKRRKYDAVRALLDEAEQVTVSDPWASSYSPSGGVFGGLRTFGHSASAAIYVGNRVAPLSGSMMGLSFVRHAASMPVVPMQSGSAWSTHTIKMGPQATTTMCFQNIIPHSALFGAQSNPLAQFQPGNKITLNGVTGVITNVSITDDPMLRAVQVECEVMVTP